MKLIVPNVLLAILAQARAGATSRAWDSFVAAGLADVTDDPAALTLKGRLLKDHARKAKDDAAARLYLHSAEAYADAAALKPDTYPLINAATMSLFAGEHAQMALLAQQVLTMLGTGIVAGETPYWHEATRAEALLLLGRQGDAQTALDAAIKAAPAAWEDRAATLRQFRQISAFRGNPSNWLAAYAPPASLYFKGMIGVAPDDAQAAELARDAVRKTNAGFGYGALAAGADILIAEALIARGAELHLVLPVLPAAFRARSVVPYGAAWLPRFDRLFEQTASVTIVSAGEILTEAAIMLAAQVAKGAAMENARRLEGYTAGLELSDNASSGLGLSGDSFVKLERSASYPPMPLPTGAMALILVADHIGDKQPEWSPVADKYHACTCGSLSSVYATLRALRNMAPDARCAVGVFVVQAEYEYKAAAIAQVLRIAQCAAPGTTIADVASARAMLSQYPDLQTEPMGELPSAGGATEIYVIIPEA